GGFVASPRDRHQSEGPDVIFPGPSCPYRCLETNALQNEHTRKRQSSTFLIISSTSPLCSTLPTSRTATHTLQPSIMCLILNYKYSCPSSLSPSSSSSSSTPSPASPHSESLIQHCHRSPHPCPGKYRIQTQTQLQTQNPYLGACSRVWEKTVHPPMCTRCLIKAQKKRRGEWRGVLGVEGEEGDFGGGWM
ncbi:hypothetical protein BCR34DRAFT_631243, partial [Clohesyomyces aquaticus]